MKAVEDVSFVRTSATSVSFIIVGEHRRVGKGRRGGRIESTANERHRLSLSGAEEKSAAGKFAGLSRDEKDTDRGGKSKRKIENERMETTFLHRRGRLSQARRSVNDIAAQLPRANRLCGN